MTAPSKARPAPKSKQPSTLKADVLIVGGGLVGGTLADALAGAGMEVVVVDRQMPSAALEAAFDGRFSAIALASRRVLSTIGLWADLAPAAAPIENIRVSEGDSLFFLHYDHRETSDEPFGFVVENRAFRQALARRLPESPGVTMLAPAGVAGLERAAGGVTARLDDGRLVSAAIAVGANGRGSSTRGGAGIGVTRWSYRQNGIVCTVEHERPHNFIAHEHFLPAGPFAILPIPGNCSSVVWTEHADLAPPLMALDDDGFLAELERRFGDFLGSLRVVGPRWAYPLSLQFAETATACRLALVGDAAHAMHPIAGLGLNLGLLYVAALAEVMIEARRLGLDDGDAAVLERYQRWRRFDNTLMLAATDALNRLFSNELEPLRLARNVGLAVVDRLGPLKRVFMRQAMGLTGDLPRLMRGEPL